MNQEDNNKKRPAEEAASNPRGSTMDGLVAVAAAAAAMNNGGEKEKKPQKKRKSNNDNTGTGTGQQNVSAARARRLEQNRKAAIESRRRKKVMVAELQRSVTFYTKANENLKKANEELEKSLMIAKQKLLGQKDDNDQSVAASGGLKTPEEERSVEGKSSPEEAPKIEQQTVPITVDAPVSTAQQIASFQPPVNVSVADQANLTAMQAVYENMGYPTATARSVAGLFSQVGATGLNDMPPPPTDDSESAGDEYIKSLEKFAMERTAEANAATLAANTAIRIANWHKMMKMNASPVMCTSSDDKTTPPPESSSSVNKKKD